MKRTSLLVTMTLVAAVVFVAGPASASKPKPSKTKTSTTPKTTKSVSSPASIPQTPASHFFVINGTANAASDHEIVGSSAFPNFTTGAVDNYYSMSHAHVDNSPFAEGTASPADTGPIGQTAAAGNFQQPQYADARWPGDTGKATYGTQGQPYAEAKASEYNARGDASEASQGFSGPSLPSKLAAPKGFDGRLRAVLAAWLAKWEGRLNLKKPSLNPNNPTGIGTHTVTTPTATVTTPVTTVTTPTHTVTTPTVPLGGVQTPPPPVTVPWPPVPRRSASATTTSSRSLAAVPVPVPIPAPPSPSPSPSSSTSPDGMSLLESSSAVVLYPKSNVLVTAADSKLGRVSLGGGQILIEGIYVSAEIKNDGTGPTDKVVVDIARATIGGVPVTIDQDGVHIAGQSQGVPYQQASDALNGALKQAGIRLFLVGPEITNNSCGQTGPGTGSGTGTGTTTTSSAQSGATPTTSPCAGSDTTSSCNQGGTGNQTGPGLPTTTTTSSNQTSTTPGTSSCAGSYTTSSCDQGGTGNQTGPGLPTPTTTSSNRTSTTSTTSSCGQTNSCDQTGRTATTSSNDQSGTTTTTTTRPTSSNRTATTSTTMTTTSSCDQSGFAAPTSSCAAARTTKTTPTSGYQTGTSTTTPTTTSSSDQTNMSAGTNAGEETITATGLHVVFTQPVTPPGVPAQYAEHILGEVFLDSLAVPAVPLTGLDLNLNSNFGSGSSSSSGSSSCLGAHSSGLNSSSGGSSGLGSTSSGSPSSGFTSGSTSSQPASGSTGSPLQNAVRGVASTLRKKPLWVLVAFLVWQALAVGTAASMWRWRKDGTP